MFAQYFLNFYTDHITVYPIEEIPENTFCYLPALSAAKWTKKGGAAKYFN
jgi:hypothetical protein